MKQFGIWKRAALAFAMAFMLAKPVHGFEMIDMVITYGGESYRYIAPSIELVVNDTHVTGLEMPPIILNGNTMVPVREVFEVAGAQVNWDGPTSEIYITYGNDFVILKIDNILANVNHNNIYMNVPPRIINGKTMVPVRFAAEALGFHVDWDEDNRIVRIDSPNQNNVPIIQEETDRGTVQEGSGEQVLDQWELARDISEADIPAMDYPETQIVSLMMPGGGDSHTFTITASSEISKVNKFLLSDNRLVIDIYNAEMAVGASVYTPDSAVVSQVRIAQNEMEPEKITRVALDITGAVDFSVTLSPDRKNIYITFERLSITDISFSTDGVSDYIRIGGTGLPAVDIYPRSEPDRLLVDIPNAVLESFMDQGVSGRFISQMASEQVGPSSARVTLSLKSDAQFSVTNEGNTAIIKIEEPTYRNIRYNTNSHTITLAKAGAQITASSFAHTDSYNEGKYILTLPGDFSSVFGYGDYVIKDGWVNSITIDSSVGGTRIIINENGVYAVSITEDAQNINVNIVSPKSVYSRIVVIDPGHGGSDPGTSGNGLVEKDLTLDISLRVIQLLEQNQAATGIKVYATRADDTYVSRFARAPFANQVGDLFVSVHLNSASPNTIANGTETYYHPHSNDNTIGITTKQTADIFQKNLLAALNLNDRKVKENTYTVLLDTQMPSVLCEIGFLSNPEDAAKLSDPEFRQATAQALYYSIVEVFGAYTPQR